MAMDALQRAHTYKQLDVNARYPTSCPMSRVDDEGSVTSFNGARRLPSAQLTPRLGGTFKAFDLLHTKAQHLDV